MPKKHSRKKKHRKWTPAKIAEAAEKHGVSVPRFKAYLRARARLAKDHLGKTGQMALGL